MIAIGGSPALAAAFAPGMVPRVQSSARSMVRMEDDADADWTGAEKWSDSFKEPEAVFDILKIKSVLPHRSPSWLPQCANACTCCCPPQVPSCTPSCH